MAPNPTSDWTELHVKKEKRKKTFQRKSSNHLVSNKIG